jgi:acyl-coenzyme A synthetase/AMP-(fatty) acid ligase
VRRDAEGYLYFVVRRDEMIKTSGYRVSPTEVEEVAYASGLVTDAVAVGATHPSLGQAIVLVVAGPNQDTAALLDAMRRALPAFMVPQQILWRDSLPRNPNGKFDRPGIAVDVKDLYAGASK